MRSFPVLLAVLVTALACGGVPVPGVPSASPAPAPAPAPAPVPELPTELPEGPKPADPYATFPPLDAGELPPGAADTKCADATSVIRYPHGNALEVYCATTAGMKQGPWSRVVGNKVVEIRTYDQGQQTGRTVRWEKGIKVAEENWAAGVQEGDTAQWNDAGILMLRGTMKGGKRDGKFLLRAPAAPEAFDGRCFQAGAEVWASTDPAEFVSKSCP